MPRPDIYIEQLSPAERLELIAKLRDSLSEDDVRLTDAQRQELDRRLDTLDHERPVGVPWEQVRDEMDGSTE